MSRKFFSIFLLLIVAFVFALNGCTAEAAKNQTEKPQAVRKVHNQSRQSRLSPIRPPTRCALFTKTCAIKKCATRYF